MPQKRATPKTALAVSTTPRAGLAVLLSKPPVTLADYHKGQVAFRKEHREFVADFLREDMITAASIQADWADARKRLAEMGR